MIKELQKAFDDRDDARQDRTTEFIYLFILFYLKRNSNALSNDIPSLMKRNQAQSVLHLLTRNKCAVTKFDSNDLRAESQAGSRRDPPARPRQVNAESAP